VLSTSPYQKVPTTTQNEAIVVTTPVVVEPQVQRKTVQLPAKATERSKSTVTTTTIRPASSQ